MLVSVDAMDSNERNLKPSLDLSNPLYKEVFFLVAQFLSGTPCQRAAKALIEELEAHELIPNRVNWEGQSSSQDFSSFSGQFDHVGPNHLPKLLELCVKAANAQCPTSLSINKSLLASSTLSFLSRASDTGSSTQGSWSRRHGQLLSHRPTRDRRALTTVHTLLDQSLNGVRVSHNVIQPEFYERLQFTCSTLGHLSSVYCVLFDLTGKFIFTGADDSLVKIWSAVDGRLLATLRGASSEISDLAVNHENTLLAAGSCDKLIRIWCLRTCAPITVLSVHSGSVTSLFFCPIPRSRHPVAYLASTSTDGSCSFWGFTENQETGQVEFQPRPTHYQERMRPGHAQMICSSFSSGGIFMAAGSADNNVRVYYMLGQEGPERILEVEVHSDRVDSISWAHEGLRFISGSKDGTALVWRFDNGEWRYVRLLCAKLLGSNIVIQEDPKRRPRVTMVAWNLDDTLVLTAVSDNMVKVWNPRGGELIRILDGHNDEVFVLESHPFNPRIICTAGHDGKIILWDIGTLDKEEKGKIVFQHHNKLDQGQGHGAVFDCKWAPDGLSLAATDSHGHLLMFTTQEKKYSKFAKLPEELFFHTDYRPLTRDAMTNECLDEQTQVPPHLMPPPFLVDMEGNPYPPDLQKLVPGRESCREEQLIPNVAVGNGGFQEVIEGLPSNVNPRSNIDEMIEQLAIEQGVIPEGQNGGGVVPVPRLSGGPGANDRDRRVVGLRRSGDVEGVRQSTGNWQRGNYGFPERKVIMPLSKGQQARSEEQRLGFAEMEETVYKENISRRPPSSGGSMQISPSEGTISMREARTRRVRRLALEAAERRRQPSSSMYEIEGVARPNPRPQMEISVNQQGTRRAVPINNRGAVPLANPRRPNGRPRVSRYNIRRTLEERGVQNESDIENMEMPSEEDTSDEDISISHSSSSSSDSDSESDWGGSKRDKENRNNRAAAEGSRKSTRKSNAASPQSGEANQEEDSDGEPKPGPSSAAAPSTSKPPPEPKSKPKKPKQKKVPEVWNGLEEIPPQYRPSEWLAEMSPKRTPYFPQIGDEVVYYRQGHQNYIAEVEKQKLYEINRKQKKLLPYVAYPHLEASVPARVMKVKFEIKPPRLVTIQLTVQDRETGEYSGPNLSVTYHDMTNVVDFIILRQIHDKYIRQNWNVGDRFRCLIDRSWWVGTISSIEARDKDFPDSKFLCYNVLWDNTETEDLSPWDLDVITDSFQIPLKGQAVPASEEDQRSGLYEASPVDWPPHGHQDAQCAKLSRLIQQVMDLAVSEAFLTPVDINRYPEYAFQIEYPIDLSTIKARLDNRFYRRADSVKFDVQYISMNAIEFNLKESDIVKHAKIITDLCKELISNPDVVDVNPVYHQIVQRHSKEAQKNNVANKPSSSSSVASAPGSTTRPASRTASTSQPQPSTSRRSLRNINKPAGRGGADDSDDEEDDTRDWRDKCRDLVQMIYQTKDAVPFRSPVNPEEYPDYYQHIDTPMDLQSVMEDLSGGNYTSPIDFHKDMNLIFSNSRQYNTDKRSQIYSMTIRLQTMYEYQVQPILTSYRRGKKGKSFSSPSKSQKKRVMPTRASSTASTPRKNPVRNAASRNPYLVNENGASSEEEHEGGNRRYSTRASHHNEPEPRSSTSRQLRTRTSTGTNTSSASTSTSNRSMNGHSPRNGLSPPLGTRQKRKVKRFRISSGESLHSHRSNGRGSGHQTRGSTSAPKRSAQTHDEGSDEFEDSDDVAMPQLHAAGNDSDDDYDSNYDQEASRGSLRRSSRVKVQPGSSRTGAYYDSDDYSYGTRFRGRQQTNYDETQNGSSGDEDYGRKKRKRLSSSRSEESPPRKLKRHETPSRKKNVLRDEDDEEDEEEEEVDPNAPGPSRRSLPAAGGSRRSTRLSRTHDVDIKEEVDSEEEGDEEEEDDDEEEEEAGSSEEEEEENQRRSSRARKKPARHSYSDEDANSSPPRSRRGFSGDVGSTRRTRGVARPDYAEDSDSEHDGQDFSETVSSRGRVRRKRSFLG